MKLFITLATLLLASGAYAASIGPAGCGLGNLLMGTDSQVLASTTNGTSGSQTFGISSGTSNCTTGSSSAQIENFIEVNKVAFANDVSRGEGESIANLAVLLGCQDSQLLGRVLKSNYGTVFSRPDATSREISNGVKNSVERNSELRNQCSGNA